MPDLSRQARLLLSAGALLGVTGVILGAWGAHGLAAYLGSEDTGAWSTGVLYHLIHALAAVSAGILALLRPGSTFLLAGAAFIVGTVLFSGSLYGLTLWQAGWLGPVTPVGGVFFIAGWLLLFIGVVRQK